MTWRNTSVTVFGLKRSGMGAIELLVRAGAHVSAMDKESPTGAVEQRLSELGVKFLPQETGFSDASVIVLSPGVPADLPIVNEARSRGIRVIGEVELAGEFLHGPVIGITGANGKTTTTAMTGHILSSSGVAAQVGGNIGTAVTTLVDTSRDNQWNVLELSSFQLETIDRFRAKIAVCLNVTPDHLDRHHTFAAYAAAKRRLFETQTSEDFAILNYEDETCRSFALHTTSPPSSELYWFSSRQRVERGAWLDGESIVLNGRTLLHRDEIPLRGMHNVENVMAAAVAARLACAAPDAIAAAIRTFPGVPHRIEHVRTLRGVEYFNDSKATNVDAALKAIAAFDQPLWLILGGKDKGASYRPLIEPLRNKARGVLVIGEAQPEETMGRPKILAELSRSLPTIDCGTLESAVNHAARHATTGDVVLLAPACSSFDQFRDYEQRGDTFKDLVKRLN